MAITAAQKYKLNHMNKVAGDVQLGTLLETAETNPAEITLAEGSILVGDNAGAASALSAKTDGRILVGNGTTITSVAVSGDATLANTGALTVGAKAITAAKMALAQGSVYVGVAGGAAAALDAKGDGKILVGNGTTITSVSVSGDIGVTNAGVSAIGAGKVLETMLAVPTADALNAKRIARATFDVGAGKAIASHSLSVTLPDNAIITGAFYDVITTFTSATDAGTIAIQAEGANDLVTATAISAGGNVFDAGIFECIPKVETSTTFIKTTAARALTAVVAVEDLTAGKLVLFVEYVVSA